MNINKVLDFITENNIDASEVFELVEKVKTMDLSDEDNIRRVIRDVSKLANKPIDKIQENKIVREILNNGVNDDLFKMF